MSKIDGAHDDVAGLFLDERLSRRAIDLNEFIEPED
jgi:hypothetical protein